MSTPPEGTWIELEQHFAASPRRMWRWWTEPSRYAQWAWGTLSKNVDCDIDLRVGGLYRVHTDVDDAQGWKRPRWGAMGRYVEIRPMRRLVYTVHWDAPVFYNVTEEPCPDELVFVDFEEEGEGTIVRMRHMGIHPEDDAPKHHKAGWQNTFDVLEKLLTETPPVEPEGD